MKTEWKVMSFQDNLAIRLVGAKYIGHALYIPLNLEKSLILRTCPHDNATTQTRSPFKGTFPARRDSRLVPACENISRNRQGNLSLRWGYRWATGLRMFAMSRRVVHQTSPPKPFIRNSCLQCWLHLCSKGQMFFAVVLSWHTGSADLI